MNDNERNLDPIERDYLVAMKRARDDNEAYELSIGLKQYREMFKAPTEGGEQRALGGGDSGEKGRIRG